MFILDLVTSCNSSAKKMLIPFERCSKPCWLMILRGLIIYTTLHIYIYTGDFNNPIGESLLTNQSNGMTEGFWTLLIWFQVSPTKIAFCCEMMNNHHIRVTYPSPPNIIQHFSVEKPMDQWFWCLPCEESPLKRQAYPWREASHPLLRRRTLRADGATVFGVHFGGHVLQLLSHHIVHGEVPVSRNGTRFTQN